MKCSSSVLSSLSACVSGFLWIFIDTMTNKRYRFMYMGMDFMISVVPLKNKLLK